MTIEYSHYCKQVVRWKPACCRLGLYVMRELGELLTDRHTDIIETSTYGDNPQWRTGK